MKNTDKVHFQDTGLIKVYYPGNNPYITKVYKKTERHKTGWTMVDGDPIYFRDMTPEEVALCTVMGVAQEALKKLGYE